MSDYIVITDYAAKDALLTGNPAKLVKGTEIKADLDAVAVAVATKYDSTDLGVTVQAYDADTTKNDVANTFTAQQSFSDNIAFTGTGNRITGDFSNATFNSRVLFQNSVAASNTNLGVIPSNATGSATISLFNASDATNAARLVFSGNTSDCQIAASISGTGTYLPMTFYTGGSERMRIDSSGNVTLSSAAGLGYGTGAGGTVTQATSKTTAVTLNKPTGRIIMNNASLGANTTERFLVNNSLLAVTDCVVVTIRDGVTAGAYQAWVDGTAAGSFTLAVRNITAGALTDAVNLSFAVIKGVTS